MAKKQKTKTETKTSSTRWLSSKPNMRLKARTKDNGKKSLLIFIEVEECEETLAVSLNEEYIRAIFSNTGKDS